MMHKSYHLGASYLIGGEASKPETASTLLDSGPPHGIHEVEDDKGCEIGAVRGLVGSAQIVAPDQSILYGGMVFVCSHVRHALRA